LSIREARFQELPRELEGFFVDLHAVDYEAICLVASSWRRR
jgi:hypothetical protein